MPTSHRTMLPVPEHIRRAFVAAKAMSAALAAEKPAVQDSLDATQKASEEMLAEQVEIAVALRRQANADKEWEETKRQRPLFHPSPRLCPQPAQARWSAGGPETLPQRKQEQRKQEQAGPAPTPIPAGPDASVPVTQAGAGAKEASPSTPPTGSMTQKRLRSEARKRSRSRSSNSDRDPRACRSPMDSPHTGFTPDSQEMRWERKMYAQEKAQREAPPEHQVGEAEPGRVELSPSPLVHAALRGTRVHGPSHHTGWTADGQPTLKTNPHCPWLTGGNTLMVPRLKRPGTVPVEEPEKSVDVLKLEFARTLPAQGWRYTKEQQQQLQNATAMQRRSDRMQRASELARGATPVTKGEMHIAQQVHTDGPRSWQVTQTREQPGQGNAGHACLNPFGEAPSRLTFTPSGESALPRPESSATHARMTERSARSAWLSGHLREFTTSEPPAIHSTSVPGISWRIGLQLNAGGIPAMPAGGETNAVIYPDVEDTPGGWKATPADVLWPQAPLEPTSSSPPASGMPREGARQETPWPQPTTSSQPLAQRGLDHEMSTNGYPRA